MEYYVSVIAQYRNYSGILVDVCIQLFKLYNGDLEWIECINFNFNYK